MFAIVRAAFTWALIAAVLVQGHIWISYDTHNPCQAAALSKGKYIGKYTRLEYPYHSCYSIIVFGNDLFGNVGV